MDTMDKIHSGILRKFHTLCSKIGMEAEDKRAIIRSYGVESSADIDTHDLIDLCASLSKGLNNGDLDRARKRAMAAIGGWLELTGGGVGCGNRGEYIKGIACRVTGVERFNAIPIERLRNVYSLFCNKQNDYKRGAIVELLEGMSLN